MVETRAVRVVWAVVIATGIGCDGARDPRLAFELVVPRGATLAEAPTAILRLAAPSASAGARDGDHLPPNGIVRVLGGRTYECVSSGNTTEQREWGLSTCEHTYVDGANLVVPFVGVPTPWFITIDDGVASDSVMSGMVDDASRAGSDVTARADVRGLRLACTGTKPGAAAKICASLRGR